MARQSVVLGLALVAMLLVTGCSGKLRLAARKMCEATGGNYSAQQQDCNYPAPKRMTAQQICQGHGGVYLPAEQYCEIETGQ